MEDLKMEYIKQPEKRVPITSKSEVLVVGGGVAGLSAAVAAARLGCKTMLIEEGGCLGGTVSLGLMQSFMGVDLSVNRGFFAEFYEKLKEAGSLIEGFHSPFDLEVFKWIAIETAEKEGIDLLLHTRAIEVKRERNKILGVLIDNKSGPQAIMSDVVVDASGDADVAAMAGENFDKVKKDEHGMTLLFRVVGADVYKFAAFVKEQQNKDEFFAIGGHHDSSHLDLDREKPLATIGGFKGLIKKARENGELYLTHDNMFISFIPTKGIALINATHVIGFDPLSGKDLTLAEIECRKQMMSVFSFLQKYVPGFENISLLDSASHIGVRESRRLIGEYVLTFDDIKKGKNFNDAIALNFMPIDIHGPGEQQTWIKLENPYQIPFRSLQAKKNKNLLVAGRSISTDHIVQGSTRSIPCCFATGQAAGAAAALAAKNSVSFSKLDIKALQQTLIQQGVRIV